MTPAPAAGLPLLMRLLTRPETAGAAGPPAPGLVRRVVGLFRPYRRRVALITLAILVGSGLGVANPILIKVVFDQALFCPQGCPDLGLLSLLTGLMVAIPIVSGAIGLWQAWLANVVGQQVMQDLRNRLYAHLMRLSLRFFTGTRTGEIQSRLANDVGGVQAVVTDTASTILSNLVVIVSTLVAMLVISWQLTVLSFVLLPVFLVMTVRVGRLRRSIAASTQRTMAEMSVTTEETLSVSGMLLAKVFDRQRDAVERFRRENEELAKLQIRQQMMGRAFFAAVGTFFSVTPAIVYLVAGWLLAGGGPAISAGTIVAFTTLQTRVFFPLGQMLEVSVQIQVSLALFQRIFEYLDEAPDIVDRPDAVEIPSGRVQGRIRLGDVSFGYGAASADGAAASGDGRPAPRRALEHVSLEIEPGQLAAIVGPSGAGKTTISYLIPRLYDVEEGAVEIDGIDVRDIRLSSLARMIGMVTQETSIFHASVRENLLYARPDADDDQLEAAARAALIHDRIMELAEGFDTIVGERGYRLSGGEKQRLAIARVVLKDPRILILDEATSSLDSTSERLIQRALQPIMAGRTTIAIAHRLSTIVSADVIFAIDRGRLVEQGTHEELLARDELYARLYREQFQGGLVEARCSDGLVLSSGEVVSVPSVRATG